MYVGLHGSGVSNNDWDYVKVVNDIYHIYIWLTNIFLRFWREKGLRDALLFACCLSSSCCTVVL